MLSGFTGPFRHYLPPDDNVIKSAMTAGLVVLDTNVLLSAYRFAPAAREELLSVIERISDRIWIPNRVAEEFQKNRLEVIADYDAAYLPVIEALQTLQESLDDELDPKIAQLANRAALSDIQRTNLLELVAKSTEAATLAVKRLRKEHGLADLRGDDAILSKFQLLLDDKTGSPLSEEDLGKAVDEAKHRIEQRIPPGYLDAKKADPYGDYIVWKQTMLEMAIRKVPFLVFVTSDNKEDWYRVLKGKTISARPELAKELMDQADAQLVMLNTTSFLFHARKYLNAKVSPETIRQSEALPKRDSRSDRSSQQNELRGRRMRDMDRLLGRISSRQVLITAIQEALENRLQEDPDGESPETIALQRHLEESRNSERILKRRYEGLLATQVDDVHKNLAQVATSARSTSDGADTDSDQPELNSE
jgi:rRNA-processing protein FCF1